MDRILREVTEIISTGLRTYLPHVDTKELEENGTIYYMNGRDGTIFDWFVNDRLCPLMCFYDDEDKMGAVRANLYKDGTLECYYFENHADEPCKEVVRHIRASEEEMTNLAARFYAGERKNHVYDAALAAYSLDEEVPENYMKDFLDSEEDFSDLRDLNSIYYKQCLVSKLITEEGEKIGLMTRLEPISENDSGWCFYSGTESDEFMDDIENMDVTDIATMISIDPGIQELVTEPIGSGFTRKESGDFEADVEE